MLFVFNGKVNLHNGSFGGDALLYVPVLCFYFALLGCSAVKPIDKHHSERVQLELGEIAFFKKEYQKAESFFTSILEKSKDPTIQSIARYNLACTKLSRHETEADVEKAMKLFRQWHLSEPANTMGANHLLLIRSLRELVDVKKQNQSDYVKIKRKLTKRLKRQKGKMETLYKQQKGKNQQQEEIIKQQEETIIQQEETIFELVDMIETLQYQISEIENLDQEIQEKRKAN